MCTFYPVLFTVKDAMPALLQMGCIIPRLRLFHFFLFDVYKETTIWSPIQVLFLPQLRHGLGTSRKCPWFPRLIPSPYLRQRSSLGLHWAPNWSEIGNTWLDWEPERKATTMSYEHCLNSTALAFLTLSPFNILLWTLSNLSTYSQWASDSDAAWFAETAPVTDIQFATFQGNGKLQLTAISPPFVAVVIKRNKSAIRIGARREETPKLLLTVEATSF